MRGAGLPSLQGNGYWTEYMVYCSAVYRKAVLYGQRGITQRVLWYGSECTN
jgi:hypothetical protein